MKRKVLLPSSERLLTPSEVGALFRVNARTVTRWADLGQLRAVRTLGGHRRFFEADVLEALAKLGKEPPVEG